MGVSFGVAVTYPVFGFIIRISSWENVFHFCGFIGIIWFCLWLYFVYDLPEDHPRIDPNEKEYIVKSLGKSKSKNDNVLMEIPWKAIITSRAVWMNIICQWGSVWHALTVMAQAPSYFRLVHGYGIEMTGIISGLPHFFRAIFAYVVSVICDLLLTQKTMSRTNVRKLASFLSKAIFFVLLIIALTSFLSGVVVNGISVLFLAFSGNNIIYAATFFTISVILNGAVTSGALASIIDISPNFASITVGIMATVTSMTGFLSPWIVGNLTEGQQHSTEPWKFIFQLCGAIQIICGSIYLIFSESRVQEWNEPMNATKYSNTEEEDNFLCIADNKNNSETEKIVVKFELIKD